MHVKLKLLKQELVEQVGFANFSDKVEIAKALALISIAESCEQKLLSTSEGETDDGLAWKGE